MSDHTNAPIVDVDPADPAVVSYQATLQHVGLVARKRMILEEAQLAGEEAFCVAVARAYDTGAIGVNELIEAYTEYRSYGISGFARRWDEVVPVTAHAINGLRYRLKAGPNGPFGSWEGEGDRIEREQTRPPNGLSVVYVLYDGHLDPCYVGSTNQFTGRLSGHRNAGKVFSSWRAFPCNDRDDAYSVEDRLLKEYLPYLNKRAGR